MYDMCTATPEVSPRLERLCRNLADGRLSSRANARDLALKILRLRLRTLRGFLAEFILSIVEGLEMTAWTRRDKFLSRHSLSTAES
jgi:hypothetical protein